MANVEEFNNKFDEPVDIDDAHNALNRFINGKQKLHIPARAEDDDMLICRALMELKKLRKQKKW